jgi:hypothetical protein
MTINKELFEFLLKALSQIINIFNARVAMIFIFDSDHPGFAGLAWRMLPHVNTPKVLGPAVALWLVLATALWYVRKRHPWSPPRTRGIWRRVD